MAREIPQLTLFHCNNREIVRQIQLNLDHDYYWSLDWSPEFYIAQAKMGCIAVGYYHEELGHILLPEMQTDYAVLTFDRLRVQKSCKKILTSPDFLRGRFTLKAGNNPHDVMFGINSAYEDSWLCQPYQDLIQTLMELSSYQGFTFHTWELWDHHNKKVIAGELGYTIGSVYTSLSGFFDRSLREYRGMGWLQLTLLGQELQARGYSFWNLGHPWMDYKRAFGAQILPRRDFLDLWSRATEVENVCT